MSNKKSKKQNLKFLKIDSHGSLGLLAYGDLGLRQWREFRKQEQNKNK